MALARGVAFGGLANLLARVWHRVAGSAPARRVEDEVRFEVLKGLVH